MFVGMFLMRFVALMIVAVGVLQLQLNHLYYFYYYTLNRQQTTHQLNTINPPETINTTTVLLTLAILWFWYMFDLNDYN